MNAQVKVLEGLLSRVQKNAQVPRGPGAGEAKQATPAAASVAPQASTLELDEPGVSLGHSMAPDSLDGPGERTPGQGSVAPNFAPSAAPGASLISLDSEPPPPPPGGFGAGPTMEQLGQTVALEEGPQVPLEVDPALAKGPSVVPPSSRALEANLPGPSSAPELELSAPPEAREELERYRLGQTHEFVAAVHARPAISTNVVELLTAQRDFQPRTFAELLDASLAL